MSSVEPVWDERGLLPAVVQDASSGTVLMVAWMNADALARTRTTGEVHFWSRSREALWRKGETSGNTLRLVELRIDCDSDTILVRAKPAGPTCHTGKTACFFRPLDATGAAATEDDGVPPVHGAAIVDRLEQVLIARRDSATAEKSYTRSLLDAGFGKICEKIAEEQEELSEELADGAEDDVVHEAADLLYHVMVGLCARRLPVERVWAELGRRFGVGGHVEKAARPPKAPEQG
jgi:phosphoribosyl-ATP pyrophosphohydrolase/phosphoribosyl-AMP cyclohydrolase